MTTEAWHKELLIQFIDQVWNAGDADAADRYIAPAYTIHHDPGDPWDQNTLICLATKSE